MSTIMLFFFKLLGILPLKYSYSIGRLISSAIYYLPLRENKIAILQLGIFLKVKDCGKYLKQMYKSLSDTFIETIFIDKILENKELILIDNPELVKTIKSESGGRLFLTGHVGNWELLAAWAIKILGFPLNVIGRQPGRRYFRETLSQLRSSYGVSVISKEDKSALFSVFRLLKKNMSIGALIDQDTGVDSLMVPFFGKEVKTPSALVDVAKRLNIPIYYCFMIRLDDGRFRLIMDKLDNKLDTYQILLKFNSVLEQVIKEYPSQWVWIHKRWRTMADGTILRSDDYINYLTKMQNEINN